MSDIADNVICIIATHINNKKKLPMLAQSVKSISGGSKRPTRIIVSISFGINEIQLDQISNLGVEMVVRNHRFSQFEHIFDITQNYLKDISEDTKILFFDDDDLADKEMLKNLVDSDYDYCTSHYDFFVSEEPISYDMIDSHAETLHNTKCECCEFGGSLIRFSLIKKYLEWVESEPNYIDKIKERTHDCIFRDFIEKLVPHLEVKNARFVYRKNYTTHH